MVAKEDKPETKPKSKNIKDIFKEDVKWGLYGKN